MVGKMQPMVTSANHDEDLWYCSTFVYEMRVHDIMGQCAVIKTENMINVILTDLQTQKCM